MNVKCVESVLLSRSCCTPESGPSAAQSWEARSAIVHWLLNLQSGSSVLGSCGRWQLPPGCRAHLIGSPVTLSCLSREGRQPRPASTQVLAADQDSGRGGAAQVLPTAHGPSAACCWEKEISDVQLLPTPPGVAFAPQGARVDGGCPSATDVVLETLLWRVGAVPGLSAQPSTLCSDLCRFC